eukprot:scaffold1356_cov123-Cylindrotheca_fusiformis.AAC.35
MAFLILLLFSLVSLVQGKTFAVPTPSFLVTTRKNAALSATSALPQEILFRGGSDKYEEEESMDEEWEEYADGEEEEEEAEIVLTDGPGEETEEIFVETFEEEEELELFEDSRMTEEVDHDHDHEEQHTGYDDHFSFVDTMQARIATANTDDENSSAFVDRMELADAYDAETAPEDVTNSLAAVTAIGGGDNYEDDEETVAEAAVQEQEEEQQPDDDEEAPPGEEITTEMKEALRDLKYKRREVKYMRPDVALEVIQKGLPRPPEGIPPNWYTEEGTAALAASNPKRARIVAAATIVALGGGAAIVSSQSENIGELFGNIGKALKSIVPSKSPSTKATSDDNAVGVVVSGEVPEAAATTEAEGKEDHPHSVKPFSNHAPEYEEDLDKTWLDKWITKVENAFKAFFNVKI